MASLLSIQGNFKQRYGGWENPLPDDHTLAEAGEFVPGENRPGLGYNFPILTGIEQGQTANVDGTAFTLNAAVDSSVLNASLDGATIVMQSDISYDVIFKSLNGTGNGNSGGAYKTALDQSVEALLLGGGFFRELALAYGPGTATAITSDIGVVFSSISGANLGAGQTLSLTTDSWAPGLWIMARNMSLDIYQADGSTVRAVWTTGLADSGPKVVGVPTTAANKPRITVASLFAGHAAVVVAATDRLIPAGWRLKSCVGIEGIYKNAGTLFNINAAVETTWKCREFAVGTSLSRAFILGFAAALSVNGTKNGGKLFLSPATFSDLANEASNLQRYTENTSKVKKQGASQLFYETAAGTIEAVVYQYQKQAQGFFVANDNFKRVGSTDLTMKPIGGGAEGFFFQQPTKAGASLRLFSNQAPVFPKPYRNALLSGIQNSATSGASIQG